MVKYCPGNFCKKKKRKFTWIYNRYPGAPRTKVTDPNNVIVSNAPTKMDTSASGIADYWLSYLPPYRVAKDLVQGFQTGDPLRIAKNFAGQAFNTASVLIPALRPLAGLRALGYTAPIASKAAQLAVRSKLPSIFGKLAGQGPGIIKYNLWKRSGGPFSPFSGNIAKGPSIPLQNRLKGVGKMQMSTRLHIPPSGAGVFPHAGDVQVINPKSLKFQINQANRIRVAKQYPSPPSAYVVRSALGTPLKIVRSTGAK